MAQSRPNILLFVADQHRGDWLETTPGLPVRTPTLTGLRDEGVQFENAVTPSPLCAPARACLASGLEYPRSPVRTNYENFPLEHRTLYGRMRDDAGYRVLGCGKFDLQKATFHWGADGRYLTDELGFSDAINNADKTLAMLHVEDVIESAEQVDPYIEYLRSRGTLETHITDMASRENAPYAATHPTPLPDEQYLDNWIARNGLDLLESVPTEQPWFLTVNFAGPHPPIDPPAALHETYRGTDPVEFPGPIDGDADLDADTHSEIRRNYSALVSNIDSWIATYLERLEERGEREETIVIYTADHGELLGDHGRWKKASPYHPSVNVPLLVAGAPIRSIGRCAHPATILDLYSTILDSGGTDVPPDADSRSIWPFLTTEANYPREVVYSALDGESRWTTDSWQMAFDGRHKLVTNWHPDDRGTLDDASEPVVFDHGVDPEERFVITGLDPEVRNRLEQQLAML